MYVCYQYHKSVSRDKVDNVEGDAEQGTFVLAPSHGGENSNSSSKINKKLP
ncbi:hypothetical protein ACOSQ2_025385 [Xanthoceras sorbifolium]